MEAYVVAYIPNHMKMTRAGATYLGKAISGSEKTIKWSNSGAEWMRQVAEVQVQELSGCTYNLVTIKTSSQAEHVIASWVASAGPMHEFRVRFPEELCDDDNIENSGIRHLVAGVCTD